MIVEDPEGEGCSDWLLSTEANGMDRMGQVLANGLNRSRGRGGFDQASQRLTTEVLFRKLRSEAIRLVSQPEQSHERFI
jgi:hypothetical protein